MDNDSKLSLDTIDLSSDDHKKLLLLSYEEAIFDKVIQIFCKYGFTKSIIEYEMIEASNYLLGFLDQIEVDRDVLKNQIRHFLETGDVFFARLMEQVSEHISSFDEKLKFVAELSLIYSRYIQEELTFSSFKEKINQVMLHHNVSEEMQENVREVLMDRSSFKSMDEELFITPQRVYMLLLAVLSYNKEGKV